MYIKMLALLGHSQQHYASEHGEERHVVVLVLLPCDGHSVGQRSHSRYGVVGFSPHVRIVIQTPTPTPLLGCLQLQVSKFTHS